MTANTGANTISSRRDNFGKFKEDINANGEAQEEAKHIMTSVSTEDLPQITIDK
jgi:hypothetical protein